jgi:hypothetical protein
MTCEQVTYLQEQEAESLPTSSSDINQSLPLNVTHTHALSCESNSQDCESSKEMSDPWTSRASWLISMRSALDFLVRTSAQQEKGPESKASDQDSSGRSCVQLTLANQLGYSLKTAQESEPEEDTSSSVSLWREDIPGETESLGRLMSAHRTSEIDGGALHGVPTPTVCGNYNRKGASPSSGDGLATWTAKWPTPTATLSDHGGLITPTKGREGGTLIEAISARTTWPTPLASDWKSHSPARGATNSRPLRERVGQSDGGPLNPEWVEWLMGWPIGHTELNAWVTVRSRSARRSHGDCLEGRDK